MANYKQYSEIYGDVCRAMGDLNQARLDEVKAVINMVYLLEIMNCDEFNPCLWFLASLDDSIQCKSSATVTGVTKANPGVVTAAAHGFADGDIVQHGTITGMTELSNRVAVVTNKAANTYELYDLAGSKINTSSYGAAGTAGTAYHRGVTLASGIENIISAGWRGYSGEIEPIDERKLELSTSWWDTANSSRPSRYLLKKYLSAAGAEANRFLWFPLPDSTYQMRSWQEIQPARLSGDTDVPILPYKYHDAIAAGAIARLTNYGQVQVDNAVVWPGIYQAHISAIQKENRAWWDKFEQDKGSGLYLL